MEVSGNESATGRRNGARLVVRALRQTVEAANGVRVAVPLSTLVGSGLGRCGLHVTMIRLQLHSG
jgi:hypothetical protein